MRLGWIGLGKLGAPAALTFAKAGHTIVGYDVAPRDLPPHPYLRVAATVDEACDGAEVVFVAVQTPHGPGYGGEVPAPETPAGFDTSFLRTAVELVAEVTGPATVVAVVSTVLPGTCRAELLPILKGGPFVYHPFFIAMGTVEEDLRHPEFVLLGSDNEADAATVAKVYDPIHKAPRFHISVESAELVKVTYNTYISLRLLAANSIMEISEKVGADCDEVLGVLAKATDRIVSTKYMTAGMGDGGACRPRDLIAMAHLADRLDLSADVFGFGMRAREAQTRWLASLVDGAAYEAALPTVVMGRAYKMGVDLEDGSCALLLCYYLGAMGRIVASVDPPKEVPLDEPAVFVVAKRDHAYATLPFPEGSIVIDPWGITPARPGVDVRRVGRR